MLEVIKVQLHGVLKISFGDRVPGSQKAHYAPFLCPVTQRKPGLPSNNQCIWSKKRGAEMRGSCLAEAHHHHSHT